MKNNSVKREQIIYVIATVVPCNFGGGEIRILNLIKQIIKQTKATVELFCIATGYPDVSSIDLESTLKIKTHVVLESPRTIMRIIKAILIKRIPPDMLDFKSGELRVVFRKKCEKVMPDIVHIEQLHTYYAIREDIDWLRSNGVKIVLDCHNVEYELFKDLLHTFSISKKIVGTFLVPHLKKLEIEATKKVDTILACSKKDAQFFSKYNPNIFIVPNGVDCEEFKPVARQPSSNVLFMGGVGYPPNADAVEFYLREIHPKVKKQIPDVQFLAIGTDTKWLAEKNIDDISVDALGFIKNILPYLEKSAIGICPLRYGSGTRLKILTYMASGLPVVSTHKGAEGVAYTHGKNIILTDNPIEFANSIVRLLKDKKYTEEMSRHARDFVLEYYDCNVIGKDFKNIYHNEI